ncbi:MAG: hypothetical protein ACSHYA_19665 [Opitutaceae bacterium]
MPVRYTRKIQPTIVGGDLLAEQVDRLSQFIGDSACVMMPQANGWRIVDHGSGDDSLNREYFFGDFKGALTVDVGVDVKNVRGEGMVRCPYVLVSATCQDKRKVDAQVAEAEVVQSFEKTFSVIGSAVVGVLCLIVQISVLRVVSLKLTAVCFIVGFFLGGLVGFMIGEPISAFFGRKATLKTEDDHVGLGVARAEWSDFIDSIIDPIDTFSAQVEATPSSVIII